MKPSIFVEIETLPCTTRTSKLQRSPYFPARPGLKQGLPIVIVAVSFSIIVILTAAFNHGHLKIVMIFMTTFL